MTTAYESLARLSRLLEHGDPAARAEGLRWLATRSGAELAHLDDGARTNRWDGSPIGGTPDPDELTGLGAALASMHPDGRRRERTLASIYRAGAEFGTALLALRCADHVEPVALAARRSLLEAPNSLAALEILAARRHRIAGETALNDYAAICSPELLRSSTFRELRRWSFNRVLSAESLTLDELKTGAEDHDQWIRHRYADPLAKRAAELDPAFVRTMLTNRYADLRLAAITFIPDELLGAAESLTMMLDPAVRVREAARWRYRRCGNDPAEAYRSLIDDGLEGLSAARAGAAVMGLTETGLVTDLNRVRPLLGDDRAAVRAAAVRAVALYIGWTETAAVLGPLLLDPAPRVAGAAARAVGGTPGVEQHAANAWASSQLWSRRAALRVLNWDGRWSGVEANLRAILDPDPELATLGRQYLAIWLVSNGVQGRPLPDEAQRGQIRGLLAAVELDPRAEHTISVQARL